MATPAVAGALALLREFFQTRMQIANPKGPLLKAALIHSAVPLSGTFSYSSTETPRFSVSEQYGTPNPYDGFGRVQIGNLLSMDGSSVELKILEGSFNSLSDTAKLCFRLKSALNANNGNTFFKATLAWYDYPSSVAVAATLVHDLDLIVNHYYLSGTDGTTQKNMTLYFGNGWFNETDIHNNVEHVEVNSITLSASSSDSQMISVQLLNKGISRAQEYHVVTSFVQGYWEVLPTSSCVYKTFIEPTPAASAVDSGCTVVINNTTTSNNETSFQNGTIVGNSTNTCVNCTSDISNSTFIANTNSTSNNETIANNSTTCLNCSIGGSTNNETTITNGTMVNITSTNNNDTTNQNGTNVGNSTNTCVNCTIDVVNNTFIDNNSNQTYYDNSTTCLNFSTDASNNTVFDNSTLVDNSTLSSNNSEIPSFNQTNETNYERNNSYVTNETTSSNYTITNTTMNNDTSADSNRTENYYCMGILYSNITFVCSGNGDCVNEDDCKCREGYFGQDCSVSKCTDLNNCSLNGLCIAHNNCSCFPNFFGDDCSSTIPSLHSRCVEVSREYTLFCNKTVFMDHEILFTDEFGTVSNLSHIYDGNAQACFTTLVSNQAASCDEKCQNSLKEFCCLDAFPSCNRIDLSEERMCRDTCEWLAATSQVVLPCDKYPSNERCMNISFSNETTHFNNNTTPSFSCNEIESTDLFSVCSGRGTCIAQDTCECNGNFDASTFCATCLKGYEGKYCKEKMNGSLPETTPFLLDPYSFGFTLEGDKIVGVVVSSPPWPPVVTCDMLIAPDDLTLLGDLATCSLISGTTTSTLEISLGLNPTVVDQSIIRFVATNPFDSNTALIPVYAQIVIGLGRFVPLPPHIVLLYNKPSISICDDVFIDASGSSSNDKRPLRFSFVAVSAPSIVDLNRLNLYIQSTYVSQLDGNTAASTSTLYIDMQTIRSLSLGSYEIAVQVISMFKQNTTKSVAFTILKDVVPSLSIDKGFSSTVVIGKVVMYTPIISFPTCYFGNGAAKFSYSLDHTKESASPQVSITSQDSVLIFGPGYTELPQEGAYYFVLKAESDNAMTTTLSFTVFAQLPPLSIAFDKGDFTMSAEETLEFRVVTQDPSQIHNLTESEVIEIVCYNMTHESMNQTTLCENIALPITTSYKTSLTPGIYNFAAHVTKGQRSATTSIVVNVVSTPKASLLRVSILRIDEMSISEDNVLGAGTALVDPSKPLVLWSYCEEELARPTYLWSVQSGLGQTISFTRETLSKSYLTLPKDQLVPGSSYSVSLLLQDTAGLSRSGSAKFSFTVNSPPSVGNLEILPSTGSALTTQFYIKCGNGWFTSNTPLTFKFLYYDELNDYWVPLAERSEMQSIKTLLPNTCLNTTECHLRVKVIAFDRFLASSEVESSVTVEKPSTSFAISTLSTLTSRMSSSILDMASVTTSLGVISSLSPETTTLQQREALSNVTTTIVNAFIQSKWIKSSTQTTDSVSATLSVFSSMNAGIPFLKQTAFTAVIDALANVTALAASSSQIVISENILNSTKKICDSLFNYVKEKGIHSSNIAKRMNVQQIVNVSELDVINNAYENLAISYLKSFAPDMPPSLIATPYSVQYSIRSSMASLLNGLQGKMDRKNSFSLFPSLISNPGILWSMKNLDIHMKSYDMKNQNETIQTLFSRSEVLRNAVSNIVEFAVMRASNPTERLRLEGDSPLANITFERLDNATAISRTFLETRGANQVFGCAFWNEDRRIFEVVNSTYYNNSCKIVEAKRETVTAQVFRTGLFMVVTSPVTGVNPVVPGKSPTPIRSPQQPTVGNNDFDIAVAVVVCVIIAVVVGSCFMVICLYLIWRKIKRKRQRVIQMHVTHSPMKMFPVIEQEQIELPSIGTV
ncbi:hypothetical protein FDP41_001861 [Naegleria fowleri]|uniref:EGF-like domain-containing protein n=1 Tax=Naegleria fowleri TaxID=5763 RepID=A0A6A5BWF6_NAEFO|nr:uncharacterized protein FDP41_001861 [Naegleria fowleri]KAF0978791.1 hypothetical protein FDP41_001861 [Naegleria fowleri]